MNRRGLVQVAGQLWLTAALVLVLVLGFVPLQTVAQASPVINYQGKLADSSGVAVTDGTYNMRFWLLQSTGQATTSAVWTESLTDSNQVQVINGLFSVLLGSTSSLTAVDFDQELYLGVEIGGTGGTPSWDGEMLPRKQLGTVPAAFVAEDARTIGGLATSSFLRSDAVDTATSLLTFAGGLISSASSTVAGLTTDTATTTMLVINNESFTDLTGSGLSQSSGVLTVDTGYFDVRYATSTDFDTETELESLLTDVTNIFTNNDTITTANIADSFLLNVGDAISGTLTLTGSAANLALGNNYLSGDGDDEGVFVDNTGRVGIGTASPNQLLSLASTSPAISIQDTDGGFSRLEGEMGNILLSADTANAQADSFIRFNVDQSEQMRLTDDGRLGLGTSTPAVKLQVKSGHIAIDRTQIYGVYHNDVLYELAGVNSANARVFGTLSSNTNSRIRLAGITNGNIFLESNATDIVFSNNSLNGENMRLTSDGDLGIGTTTPSTKLQVDGIIAPDLDNTYSLGNSTYRFSEVFSANGTINTSDERLKENIANLEYGLSEIIALDPVSFTWIDNPGQGTKLGLLAQDVEQILPEIVQVGDDADRTLGVRYTELLPVVINAIRELWEEIASYQTSFTTNELCVGDVCVTEEEFAAVFIDQAAGGSSVADSNAIEEATDTDSVTDEDGDEESVRDLPVHTDTATTTATSAEALQPHTAVADVASTTDAVSDSVHNELETGGEVGDVPTDPVGAAGSTEPEEEMVTAIETTETETAEEALAETVTDDVLEEYIN